jgi:arabinofuranosyltransferase
MTNKHKLGIFIFFLLYLFLLVRNAWASDDAFITLRVVTNILHGYGPNWNGAERVQVFTHPLWMMILIPFYILVRNPFFTLYAAGLVFSAAAVLFLLYKFSPSPWSVPIVVTLLLASKAFMDYSTSGLENPLSHLLALLFIWVFLFEGSSAHRRLLLLTLLVSFSMLNRLDTVLIFLPALLLEIIQSIRDFRKTIGALILGGLPILLWEAFSIFYYGFPFPNTYYAKLTTGIPQSALFQQGWYYFQNSLTWDHVTLPVIGMAILLALFWGEQKRRSLALGIALYLAYILYIGGDFMSGRFFSILYFMAIALLLGLPPILKLKDSPIFSLAVIGFALFAGLTSLTPPMLIRMEEDNGIIDKHGVADEKVAYFYCCGLLDQLDHGVKLKIVEDARKANADHVSLVVRESIGIYGFYAGPDVYIMDKVCLSDPLRSRLPVSGSWRIGHFRRQYPVGYAESIEDGFVNHIREPHLHEYYDHLLLVTRGNLFSLERLKTIFEFNMGTYDPLLKEYMQSKDWEKPG